MVFVTRGVRICDEIISVLFVLDQLAAEGKKRTSRHATSPHLLSAPIVAGSVVAGSFVAARRHHALPSPQDFSATSLLTILGAVEARGLGDCSRDPLFQGRCEIAISQTEVDGPSHSTWRPR